MKLLNILRCRVLLIVGAFALALPSDELHAKPPNVTTASVPSGGRGMAAKTDAQGVIHLIYDSDDGPKYVRSKDDGRTLSAPIGLIDEGSRKPGLEFITWDVAVSAKGAVHVAIGNNAWKLKLPNEERGFFYTCLLPGEQTFSKLANINHQPSEGFSIAVSESGRVTAVWMADKLYANASTDGGKTFGEKVEIDPKLDPCNCCTTSSIYGADDRLAILYREETNNERDMYLALWDQSRNKVTKTKVSTTPWKTDTCPMTYYSVATHGDGFVAAWPNKGQIYAARLDQNGMPLTPKEIATPGANGMRTGVLALPSPSGSFLVAWKKDNQLGWQMYDQSGHTTGVSGSAASKGPGAAATLNKNGDFVIFH